MPGSSLAGLRRSARVCAVASAAPGVLGVESCLWGWCGVFGRDSVRSIAQAPKERKRGERVQERLSPETRCTARSPWPAAGEEAPCSGWMAAAETARLGMGASRKPGGPGDCRIGPLLSDGSFPFPSRIRWVISTAASLLTGPRSLSPPRPSPLHAQAPSSSRTSSLSAARTPPTFRRHASQ